MNEERYAPQPPNPAESYWYEYGPHLHPNLHAHPHPTAERAHPYAEPAPWAAWPTAEPTPARSETVDQDPGGGAALADRAGDYGRVQYWPGEYEYEYEYGRGQGWAGDVGRLQAAGAAPAAFGKPSADSVPFADVARFPTPLAGSAAGVEPVPVSTRGSGREASGRRFSAVDGLRGAAVLAVLSHDTGMGGPYFSWTGAGIDILLVLTGFLTVLPLLRRATATGRTGVVGFLARRAKRLIPALLVSVAMTLTVCWTLGSPRVIRDVARQVPSVLPGHGDWAEWVYGRPLGAVPTMDSPLAPLWLWDITARSVLTWSLLLAFLCLPARRRLAAVTLVAALLAGAATVAAARGTLPGIGVVTGMQTLALPAGAGAACLVHLAERGGRTVSRPAAVLLTATGLAAAAALALSAVLRGGGQDADRYVIGVVLGAALLTAVLCGDRGPLARLLSGDLLTEIGRMSYSLFLLHLPVYWLLRRGQPDLSPLGLFLVGGTVTWFLSLLVHYLLIERLAARPRRRGRRSH